MIFKKPLIIVVMTTMVASALPAQSLPEPGPIEAPAAPQSLDVATTSTAPAVPIVAATTGSSLKGKTNLDRAVGKCVMSVVFGAILGAAVGAAAGDVGSGLAVGAGVGAVVCAVLLKVASDKDKKQIREAQLAAFNSNQLERSVWTTEDGLAAQVTVVPTGNGKVLVAKNGSLECRSDNQCRVGDTWYPQEDILAGRLDPTTPLKVKASVSGAQELLCRRTSTSITISDRDVQNGSDIACLVGDTWVTGDQLKKSKIRESDVVI